MSASIFSALKLYFKNVFIGTKSVYGSLLTSLPYLFGIGDARKEVTEQYPDPISSRVPDDLPGRSRGLLSNDITRCTGCKECEETCPTNAIRVENEPAESSSKNWVSVFDIDFSRCVFCGLCAEVCPPQSLIHTRQYEGSVYVVGDLIASFGRGQVTADQKARWETQRRQAENEEVVL